METWKLQWGLGFRVEGFRGFRGLGCWGFRVRDHLGVVEGRGKENGNYYRV